MKNIILLLVVLLFTISCHRKVPYTRSTSFVSTRDSTYIGEWAMNTDTNEFRSYYFDYYIYLYSKDHQFYFKKIYPLSEIHEVSREKYLSAPYYFMNKLDIELLKIKPLTACDTFRYLNDSTLYFYQNWKDPKNKSKAGFFLRLINQDRLVFGHFCKEKANTFFKYKQQYSNEIPLDSFVYEIVILNKF